MPYQRPMQSEIKESPEHGLRDLMGLLALPALWAGRDSQTIISIMMEAVESVVPVHICYVDLPLLRNHHAVVRLRIFGIDLAPVDTQAWDDAIRKWHYLPIGINVVACDTPIGLARMIRLSMGFSSEQGSVWFGSTSASFPSVNQVALLRAATSLTATGLVAARAASEREEANRTKDEFLAMLGHELRNPLAPITTALALMRRERGAVSDQYQDIVERQVAHLSRLVEDLLDVSRITRGKIVLERNILRVGSIITRAVEAASPLIAQREQRLSVDLSDDGVLILGDLTRLTQAVGNLLNNASKYTQAGGSIHIEASVLDNRLVIAVIDNGAGISAELMPKLFNIFEQGRVTIDRSAGGLGIGLALVKNLVELHGGSVSALSEGTGFGSTFNITLPIATPADVAGATPPVSHQGSSASEGQGLRVLLVDDNIDGLTSMEAFLTVMDFNVVTATDAVQALQVAESFDPEIAVLDIGLPGMNGYELATALRDQPGHADMRLFALTGYSQADDLARSQRAGFERHFVKPVPLLELVDALNETVRFRD